MNVRARAAERGRGRNRPLPLCVAGRCKSLWACVGLLVLLLQPTTTMAAPKETFSIDYIVTLSAQTPAVAQVRWELAGIEEVKSLTLRFPSTRITHLRGSGTFRPIDNGVLWEPGGPYAHLTYRVDINHVRGTHQRYDSYATADWVVTRAHDLFPRIDIECDPEHPAPKSRARLIFRLPPGWRSATALTALGPDLYHLEEPGKILDRPRGWFALGKFTLHRQEIGSTMVQLAVMPGASLHAPELFHFLASNLPALQKLLLTRPEILLLVSAPDPMWHGGISGEHSFYMHAGRPLRTPDKTSPWLHEMFHVLQPYKPASDADWIEEGLAEFYSLELQRRAGLVDGAGYARALGYFERFGEWNVNLTEQQDNPATNNSAPLVMYALDQRIQHATAGKKRLDDVVTELAKEGGTVDTARFLHTVNRISGKNFGKFFDRHVTQGTPPNLSSAQ